MKGLIPCGGLGRRLSPLSLAVPKELLPIGMRPAIHYHVEDMVAAGIHEIVVVISTGKDRIRAYLEEVFPHQHFSFVTQQEPRGLGFAILEARACLGEDPFVMLLPDNIFLGTEALSVTLQKVHEQTGASCLTLFGDRRIKSGSAVAMELESHDKEPARIVAMHALDQIPPDTQIFFGPAAF